MKHRTPKWVIIACILGIIVLAAVSWLLTRPRKNAAPVANTIQGEKEPATQPSAVPPAAPTKALPPGTHKVLHQGGFENFPLRTPEYEVAFYGRVVDQDNKPVPDVIVFLNVGERNFRLTTDAKGYFGLEGASGRYMHITNLEKAGYTQMPDGSSGGFYAFAPYEPKRHRPDPANPVVLHVWRMSGDSRHAQWFRRHKWLKADGRPYGFDLVHRDVDGGLVDQSQSARDPDLRITVAKSKGKENTLSVTMEPADGGFADLAANEPEGWLAPENGYTPQRQWELSTVPSRASRAKARLFFRSRNGRVYGVFTIEMSVVHEDGVPFVNTGIEGVYNGEGSRNLEIGDSHARRVEQAQTTPGVSSRPTAKAQLSGVYRVPPPEKPKEAQMPVFPTGDVYCKFVDQDDKPVSGIDVEGSIRALPPERRMEKLQVVCSDKNGLIVIPKVRYGRVGLEILQDAFLPDPTAKSYPLVSRDLPPEERVRLNLKARAYLNFGDENEEKGLGMSAERPFVRRLWKRLGPPQPLICRTITLECRPDQPPVPVDLLNWPPPVSIKPPPLDHVDWKLGFTVENVENELRMPGIGKRPNWHFTLQAVDGGLLETKDKFAYSVPEFDYKPELQWTQKDATDQGNMCIFFKARNGKVHGRATFSIMHEADYDHVFGEQAKKLIPIRYQIDVTYIINPTGSTSLEPDPKRIYKTYKEYLKAEQEQKQQNR